MSNVGHMSGGAQSGLPGPRSTMRKGVLRESIATWVVALGLMSVSTFGHTAAASMGGASLPDQPSPSFMPRSGTTGSSFAPGRMLLELNVVPSCSVVMAGSRESNELSSLRLSCTEGTVWLATLVPQKLSIRNFVANPKFVSIVFRREASGYAVDPDRQKQVPMHFGETRINLEY